MAAVPDIPGSRFASVLEGLDLQYMRVRGSGFRDVDGLGDVQKGQEEEAWSGLGETKVMQLRAIFHIQECPVVVHSLLALLPPCTSTLLHIPT